MMLECGTLLNNRYRIVEVLGQGGMGAVYRAVDENLGVDVAVKDNFFTTEEYARQFRREAVILATLRHPNLPRVTDHFVVEGQSQYLVMDYIEGEDLRQRMERMGTLPEDEVITIGAAICEALSYLGSRNPPIIHRDIKPGNIKITPQGDIFLVDFGLAKALLGTQATTTGARAMTPGYSPPEQYGTARTDQRSDIFSLGATLYAALTGAIPEDALARAMEQVELTPIRDHNPKVSRRLAAVIEKSMAILPEERYQTAEEFKKALIGSGSATRRKEGQYRVAPPPEVSSKPLMEEPPPVGTDGKSPQLEGRSPKPLSPGAGEAPSEPIRRPRARKRKSWMGCWVAFLFLLLMIVSGSFAIYVIDRDLPSRTLAQLLALALQRVATPTQTPQPTNTFILTEALTLPTFTKEQSPTVPTTDTPTASVVPPPSLAPTMTRTPSPTPEGGGGGQIAFASDSTGVNQIYIINVDGTGRQQITDMPMGACQPDWSPDGQRLVFISPCDSNKDYYPGSALFLINADGTGLLPLPTVPGGDYDPAWSPDGTRILFTSVRSSSRPQLYILDLRDNSVIPLSEKYSYDIQGEWSADGRRIIFVTTRRGPPQIWVMDADGKNQELFSHSGSFLNYHPSWSVDGKVVLMTQLLAPGGIPRLILAPYSFENYVENRITRDQMPMREGVFSPDSLWIAFEGWQANLSHDIYIITVTGTIKRQITTDPRSDFDPAWKPVP